MSVEHPEAAPRSSSERRQKMLALIEERLNAYEPDELVEKLHSYGGAGPTIEDFRAELQHSINSRATP